MHGMIQLRGRKRNLNAVRDDRGISREHERLQRIDYESRLALRGEHLKADRVDPGFALDARSGYSLGRLLLRYKSNKGDPGAISPEQFSAGARWCRIVHRHAAIMGYKLTTPSMNLIMAGGLFSGGEPREDEIAECRDDYRQAFDAIMGATRDHGKDVWRITYGICVENWPIGCLSESNYGALRIGLNALHRVFLDGRGKSPVNG